MNISNNNFLSDGLNTLYSLKNDLFHLNKEMFDKEQELSKFKSKLSSQTNTKTEDKQINPKDGIVRKDKIDILV